MENKRWMNTKEAAEALGVSESTLSHDRVSGKLGIPFARIGYRCLYSIEDIEEFLKRSRVDPKGICA